MNRSGFSLLGTSISFEEFSSIETCAIDAYSSEYSVFPKVLGNLMGIDDSVCLSLFTNIEQTKVYRVIEVEDRRVVVQYTVGDLFLAVVHLYVNAT